MLIRFRKDIFNSLLTAKIFLKIVRPRLYPKVIANSIKNQILNLYCPSSAAISITYRCQCKCAHCATTYYKVERSNELRLEEIKSILDEVEMLGVPRINICGGEPLLREDVFEIIKYASKKFVTVLDTNGVLLTKEVVDKLKESNISCVAVSIDSHISSVHDKSRGLDGCFQKVIAGLSECKKKKIPFIFSSYMPAERANKNDIGSLMRFGREKGATGIRVLPARPAGRFFHCSGALLNDKKEKELLRNIDYRIAYFKGLPATKICAVFVKGIFYISPYGEVQPCVSLPIMFGNIREEGLSGILYRMWRHKIFSEIKKENCLILDENFRKKYISPFLKDTFKPYPIDIRRIC